MSIPTIQHTTWPLIFASVIVFQPLIIPIFRFLCVIFESSEMEKKRINNEIILLRPLVEQAKIQIINKLSREIQKYRKSRAPENEKSKKDKKADILTAGILSIKKVKEDYITKYILTNTIEWKEILQNPNTEPLVRMIARIARHKLFSKAIEKFKEKNPNYLEYLGPSRREKAKLEWKANKKSKKDGSNVSDESKDTKIDNAEDKQCGNAISKEKPTTCEEDDLNEQLSASELESEAGEEEKVSLTEGEKEKNESRITKVLSVESKNTAEKRSLIVKNNNTPTINKTLNHSSVVSKIKNKNTDTAKVISKQAIVKKFSEVSREEKIGSQEIETEFENTNMEIEKEVDFFFMTGDGQSNYLSVAVPKISSAVDAEEHFEEGRYKRKFSHGQNESFFDKMDKFKRGHNWDRNVKKARWEDRNQNNFHEKRDTREEGRWNDYQRSDKISKRNDAGQKQKFSVHPKEKSRTFNGKKSGEVSEEVLHPSWQAKKKEQQLLKAGFQGKKIVFDDA